MAGPAKGAYGRSSSLKWPHLYDVLRAKGYDKSKAAAISNSRLRFRKKGRKNVLKATEAHNPKILAKLAKAQREGKHLTRKQLTASMSFMPGTHAHDFACHSAACAPPPAGVGGSKPGGRGKISNIGLVPHATIEGHFHLRDEHGVVSVGSSSREQANRWVKARGAQVKAMQTRDTAKAVAALEGLKHPDGGFTLTTGLKPIEEGYAVALKGSDKLISVREAFAGGSATPALRALVNDRIEQGAGDVQVPKGAKVALGGWHNPDDGKIEVNVTVVFPKSQRAEAIKFAKEQDQIAIAQLHDFQIINTGGTGGDRATG